MCFCQFCMLHDEACVNDSYVMRDSGKIRIAMYSSLAVKWLVPRLENLRQQHPEIDLTLSMVADEPEFSDQVADCFITAYPPKKNYVSDFLYKEQLYPFCSQKVWQRIEDKPLPEALWDHWLQTIAKNRADVGSALWLS